MTDFVNLIQVFNFSFFIFQYTFDPYSGAFVYKGEMSEENEENLFSLQDIDYRGNFHVNRKPPDLASKMSLSEMLRDAENIFKEISDDRKVGSNAQCFLSVSNLCKLMHLLY